MITNQSFLFRWLFIYFFLYQFPSFLAYIELLEFVDDGLTSFYHIIIPWLGKNILSLEKDITVFSNGSGDTTYDYVLVLFWTVVSLIGASVWAVFDRQKRNFEKLNYWLLVWLRFSVGFILLHYGLIKIVKLQFSDPSFGRLIQSVGDMSPMGLAWTFMGYSKGYNLFIGLGEALGGVLLLHRRTSLLGSLVCIVVLVNIVAINFFFDVPVKLFSSHLLVMSMIIMAPDMNRLFRVLFNQAVDTTQKYHLTFAKGKHLRMAQGGKILMMGLILYPMLAGISSSYESYGSGAVKPPLYGLYEIDWFVKNGDTIPANINNTDRWNKIAVDYKTFMSVEKMDKSRSYHKIDWDSLSQELIVIDRQDTTNRYRFACELSDSSLYMHGVLFSDSIGLQAKRKKKDEFLLMNRGFHWINEYPFNR